MRKSLLAGVAVLLVLAGCAPKPGEPDWEQVVRCLATNEKDLYPDYPFIPTKEWREGTETTVKDKLRELGASVKGGKVVDATGRELFFYRAYYVRMNQLMSEEVNAGRMPAPPDHDKEIQKLEKRYRVVRMYRESDFKD